MGMTVTPLILGELRSVKPLDSPLHSYGVHPMSVPTAKFLVFAVESRLVPNFRHLPIYRHFSLRHSRPSPESAWPQALGKSLGAILLRNGIQSFPSLVRALL